VTGTVAACRECGKTTYVEPLHGERGGPPYCPICAGAWHAEHGRKRRAARTLIKVMRAYEEAGGRLHGEEFDQLMLASNPFGFAIYDDDTRAAADEFRDLSTELLAATLALTHPDKHPSERKAEAQRVTSELLMLKPFVFPAPEPEKPKPRKPPTEPESNPSSSQSWRKTYPCEDCRDAIPLDYCNACRAEFEKREQAKYEARTARQRAEYKRRKQRVLANRGPKQCQTCGAKFTRMRTDARYCCDTCHKRAHRKTRALVTDKRVLSANSRLSVTSINVFEGRILTLLKRRPAVFVNDLLPDNRTRAQYQALCAAAVNLERAGKIESLRYYFRTGRPGFKVVTRPGYDIDDSKDIPRLKAKERIRIGGA
jgi:hypothetical protein